MEESRVGVNVKFKLRATRSKVQASKTKARRNICSNKIKDLIDLKMNISKIKTSISGWATNKVFFVSISILHSYKMKVCSHNYISQNNILNCHGSSRSIPLMRPNGLCSTYVQTLHPEKWKDFKGEHSLTNNCPPHEGHQKIPKKWHYMTC